MNGLMADIHQCPRCKDEHENLLFKRFNIAIKLNDIFYTHHATCPHTTDPILLYVNEIRKEDLL